MLVLVQVLVVASIIVAVKASKIYDRCELARELLDKHELPKEQIATWVCIARHESEYNTSAYNPSSQDHGLFQISQLFWCTSDGNGGACGLSCSALRDDDISDDVICARRIFREHTGLSGDGFNAWVVYPLYCKNNVEKFTEDCFTDSDRQLDNFIVKKNYSTEYYNNIGSTTSKYDLTSTAIGNTFDFRAKSRYFSNLSTRKYYDSSTTTSNPKYSYFSKTNNIRYDRIPTTTGASKYNHFLRTTNLPERKLNYFSHSNSKYDKITTQKPILRQNNIFSRELPKIHRYIEHPTGARFKYHINKSGFSMFKEN